MEGLMFIFLANMTPFGFRRLRKSHL
jgi:hypothetical protein